MRRNLIHLLLSVALIFQGMGVVCAYGPMSDFMVMQGAMVGNMASAMAADSNPCSSGQQNQGMQQAPSSVVSASVASHQPLLRPTNLGFPKLPLTITKSIEEMLKPPGMAEDPNILNRPLARDWADGIRLTPVFNRDVVAQFFPELSGAPF